MDLSTSTAIPATAIEPMTKTLSPKEQESNPHVFGPMRVVPQLDGKHTKAQELNVMFWIYGARDAAAGKPDVTVDFAFHQKLPEGEKYFNRTAPQLLNAESLPPDFSAAAGHQLSGGLTVPLASFPAGDYRLEIKVDRQAVGQVGHAERRVHGRAVSLRGYVPEAGTAATRPSPFRPTRGSERARHDRHTAVDRLARPRSGGVSAAAPIPARAQLIVPSTLLLPVVQACRGHPG